MTVDHVPEKLGALTAGDFSKAGIEPTTTVTVNWEDGSFCHFKSAIWRWEGEDFTQHPGCQKKYIVVYTEHCGYHVYYAPSIVNPDNSSMQPIDGPLVP